MAAKIAQDGPKRGQEMPRWPEKGSQTYDHRIYLKATASAADPDIFMYAWVRQLFPVVSFHYFGGVSLTTQEVLHEGQKTNHECVVI